MISEQLSLQLLYSPATSNAESKTRLSVEVIIIVGSRMPARHGKFLRLLHESKLRNRRFPRTPEVGSNIICDKEPAMRDALY
jgi:hypothetical protein